MALLEAIDVATYESVEASPVVRDLNVCCVHIRFHQRMVGPTFDRGVADAVLRGHEPSPQRCNGVLHKRFDSQRLGAVVNEHRTRMKRGGDRWTVQSVDATAIAAERLPNGGAEFEISHTTESTLAGLLRQYGASCQSLGSGHRITSRRQAMATYILVHGAWSGAHGFRLVRPLLQAAGHEVTTPSLTGIGERVHLTGPHVNLTTHIRDVVNHVLYEDLNDIVLLGFSYGGMVVTGALEHIGDRIRHLVYLDAFVPANGESLFTLTGRPAAPLRLGDPWLVPSSPREFDDPNEAAFSIPRRVEHPIGCFSEPVRLIQPLEDFAFTRTYIRATGDPTGAGSDVFERTAAKYRAHPSWRYREVATNHMIPNNRPRDLVDLLLELA